MNQSRLESLIETLVNVFIGYGVAVASQIIIFPWFGIHIPLADNFVIGAWFTLISIVRGYTIRRWFNAGIKRTVVRAAIELKNFGL